MEKGKGGEGKDILEVAALFNRGQCGKKSPGIAWEEGLR